MNEPDRKELVDYRLNKAFQTHNEVTLLIENELWNTAINRLYYVLFMLFLHY